MTGRNGSPFRTFRRFVRLSGPRSVVPFLLVFALLLIVAWRFFLVQNGPDERVSVEATYRATDTGFLVDATLEPVLVEAVLASVSEGQRARITFVFRLHGPSSEFGMILGDTLVEEISVSRTITYDPFLNQYRIRDTRDIEEYHESIVSAVRDLFRVSDVFLPTYAANSGEYEVRVRATVNPMVLAGPVFIVEPLLADRTTSGPWVVARPREASP